MTNVNDSHNITGMSKILADDGEEDIDIDALENSIIRGLNITEKKNDDTDIVKHYQEDLDKLAREFRSEFEDNNKVEISNDDTDDNIDNWTNQTNTDNKSKVSFNDNYDSNKSKLSFNFNNDANDISNQRDNNLSDPVISPTNNSYNNSNNSTWSFNRPVDKQLNSMTIEERKQSHINNVLGKMEKNDDDIEFIKEDEEEDEIAKTLEQIDLLKTNLEADGINLSRIPEVNCNTSKKELKAILRILQLKNDRARYCDVFEEGILAMAFGLESIFNGKNVWFGSQIDLQGWSDTVKVKLRRMRYDTSNFVSDIIKDYRINSGWRIIFELLPSLFLYSRERKNKSDDNLINDAKYKEAILELSH